MGGGLSLWHWLIVILVIVLLFGSKKIPELAKSIGQGLREFKKATKEAEKEDGAAGSNEKAPEKRDDSKS